MTWAALDAVAVVWRWQPLWVRVLTVAAAFTILTIGVLAVIAMRPYVLDPEEGE